MDVWAGGVSTSASSRTNRRVALGLALGACGLALVGCHAAGGGRAPSVLEDLALTDQDGRRLDLEPVSGRILLLNFMFTSCPVVCPRATRDLLQVRQALPDAVRDRTAFLSVSLDPENDDAPALKAFAQKHGADLPGWSFARSDRSSTERLAAKLAAFAPDATPSPATHTTALYLFDREGRLVQRYAGSPIDVPHLAREIIALDHLKPTGGRLASN
jgi:protein SCO1/2